MLVVKHWAIKSELSSSSANIRESEGLSNDRERCDWATAFDDWGFAIYLEKYKTNAEGKSQALLRQE